MKRAVLLLACSAGVGMVAHAQLPVINYVAPPLVTNSIANASGCGLSGLTSVPLDCFTFTDSKTSTSRTPIIVGRNPFLRGKTVTTVNIVVVPLIITIGAHVFDPTATNT